MESIENIERIKEYCISCCKSYPQNSASLYVNNEELKSGGRKLNLTYDKEDNELYVTIIERVGGQNNTRFQYKRVSKFDKVIAAIESRLTFLERLVREFNFNPGLLSIEGIEGLKSVSGAGMLPELLGVNLYTKDFDLAKDVYKNDRSGNLTVRTDKGVLTLGSVGGEFISEILKEGFKVANIRDNINLSSYYLARRKNKVYEKGRRLRYFSDYTPVLVKFSTVDNLFMEIYGGVLNESRFLDDVTVVETTTLSGGKLTNLGADVGVGGVYYTTRKRIMDVFNIYPSTDEYYQLFLEVMVGLLEPKHFNHKDKNIYLQVEGNNSIRLTEEEYRRRLESGVDTDNLAVLNTLNVVVRQVLEGKEEQIIEAVIEAIQRVELEDLIATGEVNELGYKE